MDYQDFEIEIRSTADGYEVRVLDSPWGRVAEPFTSPFEPEKLEAHLRGLERRLLRDRRDLTGGPRAGPPETSSVSPEKMGEALARHLFPGRVGNYLYGCLGRIEGLRSTGREVGLRLRVCFDREDRFAPLAALPWELLRPDDRLSFLSRDRWTPVVRYLETGRADPRPLEDRPRVLLVDSAPLDQPALDTCQEQGRIREALETLEGAEVEVYEHPSIEGLRTRLLEREVHVLHFLGHGGFHASSDSEHTGEGCLYFETPDRLAEPVSGPLLGVHLQGIPSLRLVVLNACWSGAFPRHENRNPFSGVAAELTRKGLPAVVAMQLPVSDGAAITFSRKLYQRLAAFDPVDAAVTEGRLAVYAADPAGYEWATPVLFLGVEDGRIFEPQPPDALSPPTRGAADGEPVRLEIRTFGERGDADEALDLRPLFDGLRPRDPRVWRQALAPRLRDFLDTFDDPLRPLELHLAGPSGLAFLLGHLLEMRSPLDLTVVEERPDGAVRRVSVEPGPWPVEALWRDTKPREIDPKGRDLALAVALGGSFAGDVERFLLATQGAPSDPDAASLAVGRLVALTAASDRAAATTEDGRRLLALAQALVPVVQQERSAEERGGTLHLFADAPQAFLLDLGQLVADLGRVQLYEPGDDTWRPSLRFPLRDASD